MSTDIMALPGPQLPALIAGAGERAAWRFLEFFAFRATGITDYLTNGGRIEVAHRMAGHSNAETTSLYDRRVDDVSLDEVERIGIQ